jgi:2-methylisocitrate lyase-like PEP mutase family enzyme
MEGGFSRSIDGILENIDALHEAGAAGINLEDTIADGGRHFQAATDFARILAAVADHLSRTNRKLFLNVRTDAFLLGSPTALEETLSRLRVYETAGAAGIFVPCIIDPGDIQQVVNATALPVNVMCMPGLPDMETLGRLGVRRISMGPFLFNKVCTDAAALAGKVYAEKNLAYLF